MEEQYKKLPKAHNCFLVITAHLKDREKVKGKKEVGD